jgi:hypothetical protein
MRTGLLLLTTVLPSILFGQNVEIGASLGVGLPQREFAQNVEEPGVGLQGYGGIAPVDQPFFFGLRLGYFNYGAQEQNDVIQGPYSPVSVEISTTNNIFMLQLLARLQPNIGTVRPYLEGFMGWNYLYTLTTIKGVSTDEEYSSEVNLDDSAFSYGGGAGVQIMLSGPPEDEEGNVVGGEGGLALDLSVRYGFGGKAKYLTETATSQANDILTYTVAESTTDLIMIHVGVAYHF